MSAIGEDPVFRKQISELCNRFYRICGNRKNNIFGFSFIGKEGVGFWSSSSMPMSAIGEGPVFTKQISELCYRFYRIVG
jgi:hypothetical protein